MNYTYIEKESVANGIGFRTVLWVSGCTLCCEECHNKEMWDFNYGKLFDDAAREEIYNSVEKDYVDGITISGGHPLEIENIFEVWSFIIEFKERYPNKTIWLYTGLHLSLEDIINEKLYILPLLLKNIDVVVDGKYEHSLRDISLPYRGSSNQRVIDIQKTIKNGEIVLWNTN